MLPIGMNTTEHHFGSDLDFIGIDAYFPVDDKQSPTLEATKVGWQKYKS